MGASLRVHYLLSFKCRPSQVWGCDPTYVADEKELEAAGVKKKKARTWEEYERQSRAKTCLDGNVDSQVMSPLSCGAAAFNGSIFGQNTRILLPSQF